jgi:hypothetical protein
MALCIASESSVFPFPAAPNSRAFTYEGTSSETLFRTKYKDSENMITNMELTVTKGIFGINIAKSPL